jgi:hypothetical protein
VDLAARAGPSWYSQDSVWPNVVATVFASAAVVYLVLLSNHYIGDGIRWYHAATQSAAPPAGGFRHLVYPSLQWLWYRGFTAVGWQGQGAVAVVARLQALNALLGAVGLALFTVVLLRLGAGWRPAVVTTLGLGASYAFAQHATDMTEVIPSFPLAMGALLVALSTRAATSRFVAPAVAAVLLGLAASIYLTSILLAPAVFAALTIRAGIGSDRMGQSAGVRHPRPWVFAAMLLGAVALLGGIAAATQDRQLADPTAHASYGDLSAAHVLGLAFGLANAQFGLVDWEGGNRFLRNGVHPAQVFDLGVTSVSLVTLLATGIWGFRAWRGAPELRRPILILGLWFVIPLGFAAWWANTYTKLWVLPIAGCWALLSMPLWGRPGRWRWMSALALVGAVALVDVGIHLGPNHFQTDPALTEADQLSRLVGANDLVLATGWDQVGVDFGTLYQRPYISYIDAAYRHFGDQERLDQELNRSICNTLAKGGRVYAVALLDLSRSQWSDFLGGSLHLDYGALTPLRQSSHEVSVGVSGGVEPVRLIEHGVGC